MEQLLCYGCVSWWVKTFVCRLHVAIWEGMDHVPNGYTIRLSYCIYVSYFPAYLQMSVLLVTRFSINVLFVFKFRRLKTWTFHKWQSLLHRRHICKCWHQSVHQLSVGHTLCQQDIICIAVKPKAKGKFHYFTLHEILTSDTSTGLVNNNISSPI